MSFVIFIGFISCGQKTQKENPGILATIDYESSGCFGGEKSNLKIFTAGREMRAILTLNKAKYATILDSNKLKACNTFIKELKSRDFGRGCTTTSFYSVKIGNQKIEKKDDGCSWDGFDILKYALFKQEIQERLNGYN